MDFHSTRDSVPGPEKLSVTIGGRVVGTVQVAERTLRKITDRFVNEIEPLLVP